jgi:hypothetical protein
MKPHRRFETKECLDKVCTLSLHHLQYLLNFEAVVEVEAVMIRLKRESVSTEGWT